MLKLQQITNDSLQKQSIPLDDGSFVELTLYYMPLQAGWFIREMTYGEFVLRSVRITGSPNILHQFRNQLPFGLACFVNARREPTQQQDFASGAASLYLLTTDEVADYTEFLSGQT